MSYYDQREHGQFNNNQSNVRRSSVSFSDGESGPKRKKWNRRGGNNGGNPINVDMIPHQPLFKEPINPAPRRSPVQNRDNFSRNGSSQLRPQPHFDMRDMPSFVEPEHSGRPWGWDNYTQCCKSWQDRHKLAYYKSRCMALEFENQMLFNQISCLVEENCVFAAERGEMPKMRLPELFGGAKPSKEGEQHSSKKKLTPMKNQGKDKPTPKTSESEIEVEVTEDMLEFLEKSMRHKLTLKKERQEEAAKKKKAAKLLKKQEAKKEEEGPKQPAGKKRNEQLNLLYGKKASKIHKLETAVQLNFNRNCDTLKPELWMAVPLNPQTLVD